MLKVISRPVYLLLYVLWAFSCTASAAAGDAAQTRPNVLLLLADDLGYNDGGLYQDIYHQHPVSSMRALDELAAQGVRFTRFYTESTCSASRVALLTGQYPARNGFAPVGRGLSPDLVILPEYLHTQGYRTYLVGKWHAGEINAQTLPIHQGFDSVYGFLNQWMLRGPDSRGDVQLKQPTYINPWLLEQNATASSYKSRRGHLEDLLTERTLQIIRSAAQDPQHKPWFIYHASLAPHTPLEPSVRFASQFPDSKEGRYLAMLAQLDDNLEKILSTLKSSGQWDSTIIIIASDNGSPGKNGNSNAPFFGKKAEYEEGGIRTPLVIKWDKARNRQLTRTDVVSIQDIYPSLVAAISPNTMSAYSFDGVASLLPDHPVLRHEPLYFQSMGSLSVLGADGEYRLVRDWDQDRFTSNELLQYDKDGIPVSVSGNIFSDLFGSQASTKKQLYRSFVEWRKRISVVPVQEKDHAFRGRDFLRSPVSPAWSVVFSVIPHDVTRKQQLLYQKGMLDITMDHGILRAIVDGLVVTTKEPLSAERCYQVALSGEFYDRYSMVHENAVPSRLHLIVDGHEVASASGNLANLGDLDISEATWSGMQPGIHNLDFSGKISPLQFQLVQQPANDKPYPPVFAKTASVSCP